MDISKIKPAEATLWTSLVISIGLTVARVFGIIDDTTFSSDQLTWALLFMLSILSSVLLTNVGAIKGDLTNAKNDIIKALGSAVSHKYENPDDAFLHLADVVSSAEKSIDLLAIAKTPELEPRILGKYVSSVGKFLEKRNTKCRCISNEVYKDRWSRFEGWNQRAGKKKFFLSRWGNHDGSEDIPIINFFIIDGQFVFMRYPHRPEGEEMYLLMGHEDVVQLFAAYFDRVWQASEAVDSLENNAGT